MSTKIITAFFTSSGVPCTGLVPAITITSTTTSVDTTTVSAASMTEIGNGWYKYAFTTYDRALDYVFVIDGGSSLDAYDRYQHGGNESYAEDISSAVLEEPLVDHAVTGSLSDNVTRIKADTTTIVVSEVTITTLLNTLLKYQRNRTRIDTSNAQLIIYDDDETTPLTTFNLKDFNGMPSVQEVCERIPQV